MEGLISYLVFWIGFTIVVGIFASSRGRSGIGWAFLSFFISPLLAGLLLAVLPNVKLENAAHSRVANEVAGNKTCPRCAEQVKRAALVCRFCGYQFGTESVGAGEGSTASDSPGHVRRVRLDGR